MPAMTYEKRSHNDKSSLTDGWHPGYLLEIVDSPKPASWNNYATDPRIWRWVFAVWESPTALTAGAVPERQTAASEQKFVPAGKLPNGGTRSASKAYAWHAALLGRQIQPGESVNLDPDMPYPCRIKTERNGEYANIKDLERWDEGWQLLTDIAPLRACLTELLTRDGTAPAATPAAAPVPPVTPPGMASWERPAPAAQTALPGTPAPASRW